LRALKYNKCVLKIGGVYLSPRTGRPKVENPQCQRFTIRLDNITGTRLDNYCKLVGKKRAEVIREAIIKLLDSQEKK